MCKTFDFLVGLLSALVTGLKRMYKTMETGFYHFLSSLVLPILDSDFITLYIFPHYPSAG